MLTILLPALLALPQDPPAKTTTVFLPLQQLCSREQDSTCPPWGTLMRYQPSQERIIHLLRNEGESNVITGDRLAEALQVAEAEAVGSGLLYLQSVGDNLLAFGEQAAVQRVEQRLAEATGIIARPLQVEFAVWDATDREAPEAVLDANGYARFVENSSPLWLAIGSGRAGHAIALEQMTWTSYVRSLEVEVAQKQAMSRPATDRFGDGSQAIVRAYPLIGSDDHAVHVQFAAGLKRGVLRTVQTGMPGAADIELPRLESVFGAFSGRIQNGGALAATLRGNAATGGQLVLTVRVVSRAAATAPTSKDYALLPCGALTTASLTRRIRIPHLPDEGEETIASEEGVFGRLPAENLVELAQSVLQSIDSDSDSSVQFADGFLFVRGTPAALAKVAALVLGLQDELIRNVEIRHTARLEPLSTDSTANSTRVTLHELSLPSLLGRELGAYRMLETNIIADVYAEVAEEAGMLVPSVRPLQAGTWFRCRAVPISDGLYVDLEVLSTSASTPPMRSVMPGGGVLMQAELATTRLRHDAAIVRNQTIVHGNGPPLTIEGRTYRSSMTTELRR